jgi:hypothetical protein
MASVLAASLLAPTAPIVAGREQREHCDKSDQSDQSGASVGVPFIAVATFPVGTRRALGQQDYYRGRDIEGLENSLLDQWRGRLTTTDE